MPCSSAGEPGKRESGCFLIKACFPRQIRVTIRSKGMKFEDRHQHGNLYAKVSPDVEVFFRGKK